MRKFCIALALSFISSQSVIAGDVSVGISFTKTFSSTASHSDSVPFWVNEVEFEQDGIRYFVGVSRWLEHENMALNQAKAEALGAMSLSKESQVNTWYEEEINHTGTSGRMQSSKRTTANFNHARSNTVLSGFSVAGVHTEVDKGFFKTKYKKYVLIKASPESDLPETRAPGGMNYYKDIGTTWTDQQTGITFVPIPETTLWMSQTEITMGQYGKFMSLEDYYPKNRRQNFPAFRMKYRDVTEYINKVKSYTGLSTRLPTKEEWQWACQSGRNFFVAGTEDGMLEKPSRSTDQIHDVYKNPPNSFNLYGMSSGVVEYLKDSGYPGYHEKAGGSSGNLAHVTCNKIDSSSSDQGERHVGFRLVIE